jgi:ribosomal protein L11 methyltransferase
VSEWIELSVHAHCEAVEAIAEIFRSRGANGVAIEQEVLPGVDGEAGKELDTARVTAYLPLSPSVVEQERQIEEALWHLATFELAPISPLMRRRVREEDWANAWKEHFHPLRVGERIVIKPSWRTVTAAPGDIVIELDPGMAFGTGLHPTTQLCLKALEQLMRPGMRVLDVGTGSGILALAAAKLGASHVLAVDTNPVAVRVAMDNVRLNGVAEQIVVTEGSIDVTTDSYDLILANIVASVIADLASALSERMAPGAILIVSGIIAERASLVHAAFDACGLAIHHVVQDGDWLCYQAMRCD